MEIDERLTEVAIGGGIVGHLARESNRLVEAPLSVESAGFSLLFLMIDAGRPRLIGSVSFDEGFAGDQQSMSGAIERKLEDLQDMVAMHTQTPWPIHAGAGGRPRASLAQDVLTVNFTEGQHVLDFENLRLSQPPRIAG